MWEGSASATGARGAGLLLERPCQQCDLTLQNERVRNKKLSSHTIQEHQPVALHPGQGRGNVHVLLYTESTMESCCLMLHGECFIRLKFRLLTRPRFCLVAIAVR